VPPCDLFADHDYDFYRSFGDAGLVDAYRHVQRDGADVSWLGPKGGQRLDHAFLTARYVDRLTECRFDHTTRSLGLSDHSALMLTAV
jgi:exonuclease III